MASVILPALVAAAKATGGGGGGGGGGGLLDGTENDGANFIYNGAANVDMHSYFGAVHSSWLTGQLAPDDTTTACKLVESAEAAQAHFAYVSNSFGTPTTPGSIPAGAALEVSVYAKPEGRSVFTLELENGGGGNAFAATFDVTAGVIGTHTYQSGQASFTSRTIAQAKNGFWKCIMQGVLHASASQGGFYFFCGLAASDSSANISAVQYDGDGSSGMRFWRPKIVVL